MARRKRSRRRKRTRKKRKKRRRKGKRRRKDRQTILQRHPLKSEKLSSSHVLQKQASGSH